MVINQWSRHIRCSVLLGMCGFSAFAHQVSIHGTVTNPDGKAISGATVRLIKENLTAMTIADGIYSFSGNRAVAPAAGNSL